MPLWISDVLVVWRVVKQHRKSGRGCVFSVNERTVGTSYDTEFSIRLDPKPLLVITGLDKLRRRKLKQRPWLRCEATRTAALHKSRHLGSHGGHSEIIVWRDKGVDLKCEALFAYSSSERQLLSVVARIRAIITRPRCQSAAPIRTRGGGSWVL